MDIDILGIDLAKRVFKLHGADRRGYAQYGAKVMRAELLKTEAAKSRKQRHTLKQIHQDLRELGFEGSYSRKANASIPDWNPLHLATVALSRVDPIPAVA